jgi:hypothetical protein
MKQSHPTLLFLFACLLAAPLIVAQPTIGGGSCSSSTISGIYAVSLTGRGVTAGTGLATTAAQGVRPAAAPAVVAGNITSVFEAIGSATFDGQSKVTFALTQDNNLSTSTPLSWSGTYSVQANCAGTVTITSGGSATLNLVLYNTGAAFSLTGKDPIYTYAGNGNTQATGCATSTLSGVYAVTATQGFYALANGTAGGSGSASGLMQFDGLGNLTTNATISANALAAGVTGTQPGFTLTGTYSLGSNCVGSAKISSPTYGTFDLNFSVYTATATYSSQMYISLASNPPAAMISGNAFSVYGQPSTTASLHRRLRGFGGMLVKLVSGKSHKGERA